MTPERIMRLLLYVTAAAAGALASFWFGRDPALTVMLIGVVMWLLWERERQQDRNAIVWEELHRIVDWLNANVGPAPSEEPPTDEIPVPDTVEAHAADNFVRKETALQKSRHRPTAGSRSVHDILAEAGQEPLRRKRR